MTESISLPRLFISAPRKSSGKTTLTLGLAAALRRRGLAIAPFKKGPDFIDPLWLTAACGRTCRNLDFHMMGREAIREHFVRHGAGADLALVESNMGLFDGLDPEGSDCGAALAQLLETPIVLVLNCQGMGRGLAPLLHGHLTFPGGQRIAGVILNNIASARQEDKITQALARYCPVPILGIVPREAAIAIEERHLGLTPLPERPHLPDSIQRIADLVERHADLPGLLSLAQSAPPLPAPPPAPAPPPPPARLTLGLARDAAFHFYYPENLEALAREGVAIRPFSPLADDALPEVDGLYLGGGFPELFLEELAANQGMMEALRRAFHRDMPMYAECGGLMLLAQEMRHRGRHAPLAALLPARVEMSERPQGFGYMTLEATGNLPWPAPGSRIPAHEFHHSRLVGELSACARAWRVVRGTGLGDGSDGLLLRQLTASYAHLHAMGAPGWAAHLAERLREGR